MCTPEMVHLCDEAVWIEGKVEKSSFLALLSVARGGKGLKIAAVDSTEETCDTAREKQTSLAVHCSVCVRDVFSLPGRSPRWHMITVNSRRYVGVGHVSLSFSLALFLMFSPVIKASLVLCRLVILTLVVWVTCELKYKN